MITSKIPHKYLDNVMKENVEYHLAITSLAKEFENIFNVLVLFQFLCSIATLVFLMYHVALVRTLYFKSSVSQNVILIISNNKMLKNIRTVENDSSFTNFPVQQSKTYRFSLQPT